MISVPSVSELSVRLIPIAVLLLILFVVTALTVRRRWKSLIAVMLLLCLASVNLLGLPQLALTDSRDRAAVRFGAGRIQQ